MNIPEFWLNSFEAVSMNHVMSRGHCGTPAKSKLLSCSQGLFLCPLAEGKLLFLANALGHSLVQAVAAPSSRTSVIPEPLHSSVLVQARNCDHFST